VTYLSARQQTSHLVELSSGIDALYVSGWGELSPHILAELARAKEAARSSGEPARLDFEAVTGLVKAGGLNRYPYCLLFPEGRIGVTDSERLPPVHLQPNAAFLHAVGPQQALAHFIGIANAFLANSRWTASRLDVFSDWQGWMPVAEDRYRFVGRATRRNTHEDTEVLTGFEFGRRKTKTITARLYDKSRDSKAKGTDWWPDVWGPKYDPSSSVLRVEFEFGRLGLRQYGIDTAQEALDRAPSLWHTATKDWLTFRSPTSDETRSRWPWAPEWEQIHRPSFAAEAVGLDRIQEGHAAGSLRLLLPQLNGYVASAAVHLGTSSIDETLEALPPYLRDYELISRKPFTERVRAKREELGL